MTFKSYKEARPGDTIARCKIPRVGEGAYLIKKGYEEYCGNKDDFMSCALFHNELGCHLFSSVCKKHNVYLEKIDK